jgi:hypothetical protein
MRRLGYILVLTIILTGCSSEDKRAAAPVGLSSGPLVFVHEQPTEIPLLSESPEINVSQAKITTPETPDLPAAGPYTLVGVNRALADIEGIITAPAPPGSHTPLGTWRTADGYTYILYSDEEGSSRSATLLRSYGLGDENVQTIGNMLVWSERPIEAKYMDKLAQRLG